MSDVMLLGVLRLPRECWSADPIFVMQQHGRCMEAADRIEADAETIETLQAEVAAERARRIKAEKALQDLMEAVRYAHALGHGIDPDIREMRNAAQALGAQYPRVEKENE